MLAVVMLINRSGTMVLPFLGIYLTDALGFTLEQAGIVLALFGAGSMVGSLVGGYLTDRFGHFYVQFLSLLFAGAGFFVMSEIMDFYHFCVAIFMLSIISESFRPANAASVSFYAHPENVPKAFSLNRMAINLGFALGPALGGLLAAISFRWLFYSDGATCMAAGLFFFIYFRKQKGHQTQHKKNGKKSSKFHAAFRDRRFLSFVLLTSGFAILFFQLFITLPLYYRASYHLSDNIIGLLMATNGMVVFLLEMVVVHILGKRLRLHQLIFSGLVLVGTGFAILNLIHSVSILFVGMFILSIAEILAMPFMVTFVVQRSSVENRGSYMGLYSLSYSLGHVISPVLGTTIANRFGFDILWWITGVSAVIIGFGLWVVVKGKSGTDYADAS